MMSEQSIICELIPIFEKLEGYRIKARYKSRDICWGGKNEEISYRNDSQTEIEHYHNFRINNCWTSSRCCCAPYVNDNIDHVTSSRSVILATYYYVLANNVNAWTFV